MDSNGSSSVRTVAFKSPKKFLSGLDPAVTAKVVASAADVALIVENGVIKDIAVGNSDLSRESLGSQWRGRKWIETVTEESRPKIEALLAGGGAGPHWRQVNHPSTDGIDVPIKYTTVDTTHKGRIVAIGRDLRSVAALQQRLVEAHQNLERDYDRLREAEARYRLLFRSVSEPILIVEDTQLKIEEANDAATKFLGKSVASLEGARLIEFFVKRSHRAIETAVADAITTGSAVTDFAQARGSGACRIHISSFRFRDSIRLIVRIGETATRFSDDDPAAYFAEVLSRIPDALVVTSDDMRIITANTGFAEMAQFTDRRQAVGRTLGDFLGRSGTDLNVLISSIRNHGSVRNYSTTMRDQFGREERVEVSGVSAPSPEGETYGFSIRNVARRLEAEPKNSDQLPRSVDQLTGLVGKVALKDIVRESTDLIEKLCIEAALDITDDNRASAAEMLGLSRQGLYSKLKRFGFDD